MDPTSTGTRNRVVAHFKDGRILKGFTHDFLPARGAFHLTSEMASEAGAVHDIKVSDLKALFFVKCLIGDSDYEARQEFDACDNAALRGLKIRVEFRDGEVLLGVSLGYNRSKPGFFLIPVDPEGNNQRVYVVADACRDVKVGAAAKT
jgi:hypothetical protein